MKKDNKIEEGKIVLPQSFLIFIKGILLYSTAIAIFMVFISIDSLLENNSFLFSLFIVFLMVLACKLLISKKDYDILTFSKYFKND